MGNFEGGRWIIGILIYYIIFFTIVGSVSSMFREVRGFEQDLDFDDSAIKEQQNIFLNQATDGLCRSTGFFSSTFSLDNPMTILRNIKCNKINVADEQNCNGISGCLWKNETNLFNFTIRDALCSGNVNKTHFGIIGHGRTYCKETSSFQNNASLCYTMGCQYINKTEIATSMTASNGLITMWENVKFIISFRADFSLGTYDWLASFILFYVPFMMLLWAFYRALWPG